MMWFEIVYNSIFSCMQNVCEWMNWMKQKTNKSGTWKCWNLEQASIKLIGYKEEAAKKKITNTYNKRWTIENCFFIKKVVVLLGCCFFPFAAFYRVCLNGKSTFILFNIIEFSAFFNLQKKVNDTKKA